MKSNKRNTYKNLQLKPSGFCHYCGHPIKISKKNLIFGQGPYMLSEKALFCNPKHEEMYRRKLDSGIKKSKKDGYGIAGSCR